MGSLQVPGARNERPAGADGSTIVLMFSGGRDSTIAAVRLSSSWQRLVLVTVSSRQLSGMDRVFRRLVEIRSRLAGSTQWLNVVANDLRQTPTERHDQCLTCHLEYLAVGAGVADLYATKHIAVGYSGYQSSWPEQTPYAIAQLGTALSQTGKALHLPVADLASKEDAIRELAAYGLSVGALEQRCERAITPLPESEVVEQVDLWARDLRSALANVKDASLTIAASQRLEDISAETQCFPLVS